LAADCLSASVDDGPLPVTRRLPKDAHAVWTSLNQSDGIATGDGEHRAGVELRDPFTDGELVSFILSIPAYALYNRGASKQLLRMAMAYALPEPLLARPTRSDIEPLFWRGFGPEGPEMATGLLECEDASWERYVKAGIFLADKAQPNQNRIPALVRWRCLSFEWWMMQRASMPVKAT
jgi:asparagine synthetase B (glutamine-hydrolysing)